MDGEGNCSNSDPDQDQVSPVPSTSTHEVLGRPLFYSHQPGPLVVSGPPPPPTRPAPWVVMPYKEFPDTFNAAAGGLFFSQFDGQQQLLEPQAFPPPLPPPAHHHFLSPEASVPSILSNNNTICDNNTKVPGPGPIMDSPDIVPCVEPNTSKNRKKRKSKKRAYVYGASGLRKKRSSMRAVEDLFNDVEDVMSKTPKPITYPTGRKASVKVRPNANAKMTETTKFKLSTVAHDIHMKEQIRSLKAEGLHPHARAQVLKNGSVLVTSFNGGKLIFPKVTISLKSLVIADVVDDKQSLPVRAPMHLSTHPSSNEPIFPQVPVTVKPLAVADVVEDNESLTVRALIHPTTQLPSNEPTSQPKTQAEEAPKEPVPGTPAISQKQKRKLRGKVPKKIPAVQPSLAETEINKHSEGVKTSKNKLPDNSRLERQKENKQDRGGCKPHKMARKISEPKRTPKIPEPESKRKVPDPRRARKISEPKRIPKLPEPTHREYPMRTLAARRPRYRPLSPPYPVATTKKKENDSFVRSFYSNELAQGRCPSLFQDKSKLLDILKFKIPKLSKPANAPVLNETPLDPQSALELSVPNRFERHNDNYALTMVPRARNDFKPSSTFVETKNGQDRDERELKAPPSTTEIAASGEETSKSFRRSYSDSPHTGETTTDTDSDCDGEIAAAIDSSMEDEEEEEEVRIMEIEPNSWGSKATASSELKNVKPAASTPFPPPTVESQQDDNDSEDILFLHPTCDDDLDSYLMGNL